MTSISKRKVLNNWGRHLANALLCSVPMIMPNLMHAECPVPSLNKLNEVQTYVARLNRLQKAEDVKLTTNGPGNQACFWKLSFATTTGHALGDFFLSPDGEFIIPKLFDLRSNPLEDDEKHRILQTRILSIGHHPVKGLDNATTVLVEFADFECPFCKRQWEILKNEILTNGLEKIRLEYRHFPLAMHSWAMEAAQASACVYEQNSDDFWLMHDYLYTTQAMQKKGEVVGNILKRLSGRSSFNEEFFQKCMHTGQGNSSVQADLAIGRQLRIEGTPTLFINGMMFKGLLSAAQIHAEIQRSSSALQTKVRNTDALPKKDDRHSNGDLVVGK